MSCQPATPHKDKKGRKGVKYHDYIRIVLRMCGALKKSFGLHPLILYSKLLVFNTAISTKRKALTSKQNKYFDTFILSPIGKLKIEAATDIVAFFGRCFDIMKMVLLAKARQSSIKISSNLLAQQQRLVIFNGG